MKLIGIPLSRPKAGELTAATIMGTGLWVAIVGIVRASHMQIDSAEAGALLLVVLWACVSARLGIRIGMGFRHLAANLLVSAILLGLYEFAWLVAA